MSDLLFETPGNPVPANADAGILTMRDGVRIRYATFAATGRPLKGSVIVIPGRNECIEKYFETIADLCARGLGVAIFDLRGQGGSDRLLADPQRGYITDFELYVQDLHQLIEDVVLPDCRAPYYLLGHSTGALVSLLAAPSLMNRIRRMVLCAPLITLTGFPFSMRTLLRLSTFLFALGLGRRYMAGGRRPASPVPFANNRLTTDHKRYERNQQIYIRHPHLALGGPTVAWVRAACRASETVTDEAFIARIHVPTLIVAAGGDEVVSTPDIALFARSMRSGSLLTINGARHEILQEADLYREQFLAAFDAFVPGSDTAEY